ncbi:MAG: hypothetical protein L0I95_10175, partial [Tetragenococcus koreensis]|nr:hypothetical protein [Tetragenococcus koreensis]MDN6145884.1 hypothetical protein [Tetragenococcus koreensis]MDN6165705.1 hypothetical protein [Tetragenococcus koreensis]MDN6243525.1 hypothetical protein [Tetragenococcus koreensis]MDN6267327.1 hypothetical protein [Tetragenococcus koreensis]
GAVFLLLDRPFRFWVNSNRLSIKNQTNVEEIIGELLSEENVLCSVVVIFLTINIVLKKNKPHFRKKETLYTSPTFEQK